MKFWIFMLKCVLILPVSMIITGIAYRKGNYPQKINSSFGYRTKMSMKNKETWEFAQKQFGKIWFLTGTVIFLPSVVPMLFVVDKEIDFIGWFGGAIVVIQVLFMIVPMILTENSLKKQFDETKSKERQKS